MAAVLTRAHCINMDDINAKASFRSVQPAQRRRIVQLQGAVGPDRKRHVLDRLTATGDQDVSDDTSCHVGHVTRRPEPT